MGMLSATVNPLAKCLCIVWLAFVSCVAHAGELTLGVAAGSGSKSNPLVDSKDIDLHVIADLSYYGDRLFFDNGDLGVNVLSDERQHVNAVLSLNSQRVERSYLNDSLLASAASLTPEGISAPDRNFATELGLEWLFEHKFGDLQAQVNHDVSSTHNGSEVWLNYGYRFLHGQLLLNPSISLSWKSRELNNYYYGVTESEATSDMPAYEAGSGLNTTLSLSSTYFLSEKWRWVSAYKHEFINSEASNSPFMEDDHSSTFFTGLYYSFM